MPNNTAAGFALKHRSAGITLFSPQSASIELLAEQLQRQMSQAPALFSDLALVIDAEGWPPSLMLADVLALLERYQITPMGITPVSDGAGVSLLAAEAKALTLAVVNVAPPKPQANAKTMDNRPLVISQPVRSGQKVVARHRDLILLGAVSNGAEVIADGHIHCCGVLRGKAYVGASGDESAQLFCQNFDAELVAVAGLYQLHGEWPAVHQNKPVRVAYTEEKLVFTAL